LYGNIHDRLKRIIYRRMGFGTGQSSALLGCAGSDFPSTLNSCVILSLALRAATPIPALAKGDQN